MTLYTFPLTLEVPPTAVFSASATPLAGITGSDETPAGWPTKGVATALEVDIDVTTNDADYEIALAVANDEDPIGALPDAPNDASGTWSSALGETRAVFNDVSGWRFTKLGTWRTDYITINSGDANTGFIVTNSAVSATTGVDIRVRFRVEDLTDGDARTLASRWDGGGQGCWALRLDSSTLRARIGTGGGEYESTIDHADIGAQDDEWTWARLTYDNTDRLKWWSSSDGITWTVEATDSVTGATDIRNNQPSIKVGNGFSAGGYSMLRLRGDISHFEFYDGTDLLQSLDLDRMTASNSTTWTSRGESDWDRSPSDQVVEGATISESATATFTFDKARNVTTWRLLALGLGPNTEFDITEIRLTASTGARRGLGLVR